MQAQRTEPVNEDVDPGLVLRVARKQWTCEGNGSRTRRHAEDCDLTIFPGEHYVECMWEAPGYQSGSRHSPACAREFLDVVIRYEDGGRRASLVKR